MPLLATFIASLFTSVATFVAQYFTKRIAIAAALVAVLVTVTGTFVIAINALIDGILVAAPADLIIGASWVVPSNVDECMAAIATAHALRWAYDWQTKAAMIRAG